MQSQIVRLQHEAGALQHSDTQPLEQPVSYIGDGLQHPKKALTFEEDQMPDKDG